MRNQNSRHYDESRLYIKISSFIGIAKHNCINKLIKFKQIIIKFIINNKKIFVTEVKKQWLSKFIVKKYIFENPSI